MWTLQSRPVSALRLSERRVGMLAPNQSAAGEALASGWDRTWQISNLSAGLGQGAEALSGHTAPCRRAFENALSRQSCIQMLQRRPVSALRLCERRVERLTANHLQQEGRLYRDGAYVWGGVEQECS